MFLQFYGITLTVKKWLHYTGVNVLEKNPQPLMPFNIGLYEIINCPNSPFCPIFVINRRIANFNTIIIP
jgi:hypothetical protein